ncbi:MAG: hypothetical protein JW908_15495 [Anaerolineales bacterium]|nr:hypothetical protein [Anaerolineales bacterium]
MMVFLSGCQVFAPAATPTPIPTDTPIPPTDTPLPPSPTPIPPTATYTFTPPPTIPPQPTNTVALPTPSATASGDDAIYFYVLKLESKNLKKCGGETPIAINTGIYRTNDVEYDVKIALQRLFSYHGEYFGELYNPIGRSNFSVGGVSLDSSGAIIVDIGGEYVKSDNKCDGARVRLQVITTCKQFPGNKACKLYLNGGSFADLVVGK